MTGFVEPITALDRAIVLVLALLLVRLAYVWWWKRSP
jgi:hypothetical protein